MHLTDIVQGMFGVSINKCIGLRNLLVYISDIISPPIVAIDYLKNPYLDKLYT
jgi:uncharacterized protein YutE (UPF0331/DUF86 family)